MTMSEGASLLTFLDAPVLVGDPEGRVIYVNPSFEQRFERSGREVQGEHLASLFSGGGREAVLGAVADVCRSGRTRRFRLREGGQGFVALVSSIQSEGQSLGVIILLTDEPLADERVLTFHREMQEPLDEIRACLDEILEQTGGRRGEQYRASVESGLRALERARKWCDGLHGLLSGRGPEVGDGGAVEPARLLRQVAARVDGELRGAGVRLEILVPARIGSARGDEARLESALVHWIRDRIAGARRGDAFTLSARAVGAGTSGRLIVSLVEPSGDGGSDAGDSAGASFLRDTLEALRGGWLHTDVPGAGRVTTLSLPLGGA